MRDLIGRNLTIVCFLMLAAGQVVGYRALDSEREARERDDCRRAQLIRDEQEQGLVDVVLRLGGDPENPRVVSAIEIVHDVYGDLPAPTGC